MQRRCRAQRRTVPTVACFLCTCAARLIRANQPFSCFLSGNCECQFFLLFFLVFWGADSAPGPPLSSRQNKKISCVHAAGQLGTHQPAAAQPGNCAPLMVFAILRSHIARMAADRAVRRFIRPAAVLPWLSVLLGAFRSDLQRSKTAEPSAGPAARALSNKRKFPLGRDSVGGAR